MGSVRIGYKASAEQFDPATLLEYTKQAEAAGLEIVATSDHFQPWRHHGGHSPAALPWLGAAAVATDRALLGTSVLTPTLRYEPAIVAQAFATLGCLAPGRVFLGVGTGEAMNETPATGAEFPGRKERRLRMAEAIELIRKLWREERVDFEGEYYKTSQATIYDRPTEEVPIYVAASGPAGGQARRPRRRRLHLHLGQEAGAVHRAAGEGPRGRRGRRARPRADPQHDRDQGLLRPRQAEGL